MGHAFLLLLATATTLATPPPEPEASVQQNGTTKPHMFFVLVDDLGYGNVGFNRDDADPEVKTPHLDKIVSQGVRLTRHYVHRFCTPSRTSLQSGRLPVHVNTGLGSPCSDNTGIPHNMTGMAEHLQAQGYVTAMAGKWDAGMATPAHTPHGRGYDTSLNYFSHKNDFWSQANMQTCCESDQTIIDFWHTDKGASTLNSTDYSEFLYQRELLGVIAKHDATKPLMMFYAPHVAHCPLQVPKQYYDAFSFMTNDEPKCQAQTVKGVHTIDPHFPNMEYKCRQQYHAMVSIMDEVVGNITAALMQKGMWDNTLMIFSSDNGGPVDLAENAANNWPKRGGKYSVFEGGICVAAFISGGVIPTQLRGTSNNGIVHIADWYGTLVKLAGGDPTDHRAAAAVPALPPIDSVDVWPFLSDVTKKTPSPRTSFPVDSNCVVDGEWKLITSASSPSTYQCPNYPNSTSKLDDERHSDWIGARDDHPDNGYMASRLASSAPPRPIPRLAPCHAGSNATLTARQQWQWSKQGAVCTSAKDFSRSPCWNVQQSQTNIILYGSGSAKNEQFQIQAQDGTIHTALRAGCIGATANLGGLTLLNNCNDSSTLTHGFSYDAKSGQISVPGADGSKLCVTADLNGTTPTPGPAPKKGMCADGCLFNVVTDPTEQNNVYAANPDIVAKLMGELNTFKAGFFQNHDKFTNECPSGTKNCACWMAKSRYGGFMGPYALLGGGGRAPL